MQPGCDNSKLSRDKFCTMHTRLKEKASEAAAALDAEGDDMYNDMPVFSGGNVDTFDAFDAFGSAEETSTYIARENPYGVVCLFQGTVHACERARAREREREGGRERERGGGRGRGRR